LISQDITIQSMIYKSRHYTSAGRAFDSGCFLCFALVLEPKHIVLRPKGEVFWPQVLPEVIDPRFCFGYPRNRVYSL